MPAGIEITNTDHTAEEIRELARKCKNRAEARRLRAIARVMEGEESRAGIARRAKVDRQTLCDWVNRYNAMGLSGLKAEGQAGPWVLFFGLFRRVFPALFHPVRDDFSHFALI